MTLSEYPWRSEPFRVGETMDWPGPASTYPNLWLPGEGQSLLRTTYWALFLRLVHKLGEVTFTNASPAVFTNLAGDHGLIYGDPVFLLGGNNASPPPSIHTQYYVMTTPSLSTFTLGSVRTYSVNGIGNPSQGQMVVSSAVNAGGAQTATNYVLHDPHGIADSTHFYLPDFRRRPAFPYDRSQNDVLGLPVGEAVLAGSIWPGTGSLPVAQGVDYGMPVQDPGIYVAKLIYTGVSP